MCAVAFLVGGEQHAQVGERLTLERRVRRRFEREGDEVVAAHEQIRLANLGAGQGRGQGRGQGQGRDRMSSERKGERISSAGLHTMIWPRPLYA